MTHAAPITNPQAAHDFIFAGRATVTLVSRKTGSRYTVKVSQPREAEQGCPYFVSTLIGSDNDSDYAYIGFIPSDAKVAMIAGRKGNANHPAFKALEWTLRQIDAGTIPEALEIWHEGRCGRCNRKLTVPESLATGFGPECADKVGLL